MDKLQLRTIGKHLGRYVMAVGSVLRENLVIDIEDYDRGNDILVKVVKREKLEKEESMSEESINTDLIRIELEQRQASIEAEVSRHIEAIRECASAGDPEQARATLEILLKLTDVRRLVRDTISSLATLESTPVYTVGSWFLKDCFNYLVREEVEALHYVTGIQFANTFTLDKMVTFEMNRQTVVSARGDINSTHKVLIEMEEYGHKLHACFHSHPGQGQAATFPSSVDLDYQARLEKGGYAAIGGIFSRDGYFRAFSLNNPFRISVYGKGVERIDDKLYRLN